MATPILEIVSGLNGCGKSTFAESYLGERDVVFLNPDALTAAFSPTYQSVASSATARLFLETVKTKIKNRESFGFESTLSGRSWIPILNQAKASGYDIHIYFLYLNRVSLNLSRIRRRVKNGGHDIPRDDVIRRSPRCFENFWNEFRPLASNWFIFNNTKKRPQIVLSSKVFNAYSNSKKINAYETIKKICAAK